MKAKPITINGTQYNSLRDAARSMGVTWQAIQKAIKGGRNPADIIPGNPTKRGVKPAEKPITIQGVEYPSQAIAAEVLGLSRGAIASAKKRGRLDFVGCGRTGRPPKEEH